MRGPDLLSWMLPRPGCGKTKMQMTMSTVRTAEAERSLTANPPSARGLSKELAIVAPSGRVRTKAAQNSRV